MLKNSPVYPITKILSSLQLDSTQQGFGHSISVNDANTKMAVGIPFKGNGEVHIYVRPNDSTNFILDQILDAPTNIAEAYDGSTSQHLMNFGESVALSPDGKYLAVGSQASNTKSYYPREFRTGVAYPKTTNCKIRN